MGRTICAAVAASPTLELVAAIDPSHAGTPVSALVPGVEGDVVVAADCAALASASAEVAVDFTHRDVAMIGLRACAADRIHVVSGTTGLAEPELTELASRFGAASTANCIWAPNFAIGAVLMLWLAELAAPFVEGIEVIEAHHEGKRDAPSGTALATLQRCATARAVAGVPAFEGDSTVTEVLAGARGGVAPGGARVHSVRLPGLVAHEEVLLGAPGQLLTIRHDAFDRTAFVPGVLAAIAAVPRLAGLTIGLDAVLGIGPPR
jgi:4-hydroxy-tetrahydrodipicolinate reductase